MLVPCRDLEGRVVALKVRNPRPDADPKYYYLSSGSEGPSSGAPVHVPRGTPRTADLVRATEGELKADGAFPRTGIPTLSVPGVSNWRPALAVLAEMQAKTIRLAFDADWRVKPHVAQSLADMAEALAGEGYRVEMEVWPTDQAGNPKGLDDLLVAGGTPEILAGDELAHALDQARKIAGEGTKEGPSKTDIKARISKALEDEGPSGFFEDEELLDDLAALKANNSAAYASVESILRAKKVPMRCLAKVMNERKPKAETGEESSGPTYDVVDGCLSIYRKTENGPKAEPIALFDAQLVAEVIHDDGSGEERRFALEGVSHNGTRLERIEIPADEYDRMEWVTPGWGQAAILCPGRGIKDHVRFAIQWRSGDPPRERTYGHLGWREIEGEWLYLHAGGGIGSQGDVPGVRVELPDDLTRFVLPTPPTGEARRRAVHAALGILRAGRARLTYPLLAAAFRAVMGPVDLSIHLVGDTGTRKTSIAAVIQQLFGSGMPAEALPASWKSTANALETLLFATKDALVVVDEFSMGTESSKTLYDKADRVFRGAANASGRGRLNADAELRTTKHPRGFVLSTGEESPTGESLRSRVMILRVEAGDILLDALSACQQAGESGLLASAMAAFVAWLAPRMADMNNNLKRRIRERRESFLRPGQHTRTSGMAASLDVGLAEFLTFAEECRAITREEGDTHALNGCSALVQAADAQTLLIKDEDQAALFLSLLRSGVASGAAHLSAADGVSIPVQPSRFGWRPVAHQNAVTRNDNLEPRGKCIGFVDGEGRVFLEPEAAYGAASEIARGQGQELKISKDALRNRLKEKGYLAGNDKGHLTTRKTFKGQQWTKMLHVRWDIPEPLEDDEMEM